MQVDPRCPKCGSALLLLTLQLGAVDILELTLYGPAYGCGSRFVGEAFAEDKFCVERQRDQWEMAAFCERERILMLTLER